MWSYFFIALGIQFSFRPLVLLFWCVYWHLITYSFSVFANLDSLSTKSRARRKSLYATMRHFCVAIFGLRCSKLLNDLACGDLHQSSQILYFRAVCLLLKIYFMSLFSFDGDCVAVFMFHIRIIMYRVGLAYSSASRLEIFLRGYSHGTVVVNRVIKSIHIL